MDQELVQYLDNRFQSLEQRIDQRFGQVDQRFEGIDQRFDRIDRRFDRIDRRFEGVDRQFAQMRQEMNAGFDEVKRHNGVLIEDLRYQLQLVAEGLATHIEVKHTQDREYYDGSFDETNALIRSSYSHLQQQHDRLNQRVENLERKDPG